ncbi:argininosuccinate synthase [Novimethylophilus kurashikiensis]|uniref:Argininosuccinate synthase n=1 Tax=Novimethylophilus kurashikiensis TaxID=1825523 RepID=A0A2R5FCB8_9PROT|nr:hypothetical protein [Novimethylophilus kurashikiensis]GBG14284.1 argininosuccinate synthase [Novimethylophilus kurashikiensis]
MSKPGPILVLSRLKAEQYTPSADAVCVSITNPRQSPAALAGWSDLLRLGFHDTDRKGGNFVTMSLGHAGEFLRFCQRHKAHPLMVHCEAGASRSVAAGLFAAAWMGRQLELTATDVLAPNPWVIRMLRLAGVFYAIKWVDSNLLKVSLLGPLAFRYTVLPPAIADTYLD